MFEKFKEKCKALSKNRAAVVTFVIILLTLTVVLSVSIATNRAKKNTVEEQTTAKTPSEQSTEAKDEVNTGTVESPSHNNTETKPVSGEVEEFELSLPAQGVIAKGHDATIQVWSETMGDYRVHLGIDIATSENAPVFACADGTVEKIWDDALMGRCVAISHGDEIYTFYKNLDSDLADGISKGAKVERGQKLGEVGNTAIAELADEPHIHIEMTVNGLAVDPRDYFSAEAKNSLQNSGK
jgi:murein DD-endopeptidase MepM/ murein hydrolase activator NlpD